VAGNYLKFGIGSTASDQLEGNTLMSKKIDFHIHQTHHSVADFKGIFNTLKQAFESKKTGIHLFPELFLTGYPLQDLCLQKPFIDRYQEFMIELESFCQKLKPNKATYLVGGLSYELTEDGLPLKIKNVIYLLEAGKAPEPIYTKQLLPNYDIFDEMKYFTAGAEPGVIECQGATLGLLICEDMWTSNFYRKDAVKQLKDKVDKESIKLDAIINLSASPFSQGKVIKRVNRSKAISNLFRAPFIYVNRVGGEDEVLFDGQSLIVNGDSEELKLKRFEEDAQSWPLSKKGEYNNGKEALKENTWEELFSARIDPKTSALRPLTGEECEELIEAMCFGVQEYARKSGFSKFTIALSGGMDSALVLALLKLSLKDGQYLEAIYMPSVHSSTLSYDCCLDLCEGLGVRLKSLPIKFMHSAAKNLFVSTFPESFEGLTDENVQSRLRGALLYTRSNQVGSMVVNTSNKSELAVGYSTQYGDSVGAISILGDLYKSEVFAIARHINETRNGIIPEKIIARPPSAELRPDQEDAQSLPPYERLDAILEGILTYRYSAKDLIELKLPKDEVQKTFDLYRKSEFKRRQFCPIVKLSSKSFGFGYRIPLSKASSFYME